ncbi:MAG: hypothetical protein AB7F28_05875 [Candidatus Margulisiibacteriota bacterium]
MPLKKTISLPTANFLDTLEPTDPRFWAVLSHLRNNLEKAIVACKAELESVPVTERPGRISDFAILQPFYATNCPEDLPKTFSRSEITRLRARVAVNYSWNYIANEFDSKWVSIGKAIAFLDSLQNPTNKAANELLTALKTFLRTFEIGFRKLKGRQGNVIVNSYFEKFCNETPQQLALLKPKNNQRPPATKRLSSDIQTTESPAKRIHEGHSSHPPALSDLLLYAQLQQQWQQQQWQQSFGTQYLPLQTLPTHPIQRTLPHFQLVPLSELMGEQHARQAAQSASGAGQAQPHFQLPAPSELMAQQQQQLGFEASPIVIPLPVRITPEQARRLAMWLQTPLPHSH